MAVFRFRLESVLRYRDRLRRERQWELHALEERRDHLASEINRLEQLIVQQAEEIGEQRGKVLSVADISTRGKFSRWLDQSLHEQRELLATVLKSFEEKRDDVIRADRDVKTIEQLRHRLQEKHRTQEMREEQKFLDEVGQRRPPRQGNF